MKLRVGGSAVATAVAATAFFALLAFAFVPQTTAAPKAKSFDVRKPTIIAFFPPLSDKELDDDEDASDALDDFQDSADEVRAPLRRVGVDFIETYTRQFIVHAGSKTLAFRSGKDRDVGYYFIAPGKKPRIEYGVMADDEILDVAHEYFGVPIPGGDSHLRTAALVTITH